MFWLTSFIEFSCYVSLSGRVLNVIKRIDLLFFLSRLSIFTSMHKFSFVKSILILQSGWYFGAYFIVFYEQHTLNLHCNSFIYLGIFKYLLYRKVFSIHHFMYGIFFVYCFLFISIHYWVFFFSILCQYLGKMYLLVTCVAF